MERAPFTSSFGTGRPNAARAITVALRRQRPDHRLWPWLLALLLLLALATGVQAQVAINATNAAPNTGGAHSILDISSTNKGLLAPRMLNAHRINLTSAPPPDGLLVYQTDSAGSAPRGYYYWDNSTSIPGWRHIAWGPKLWELGGNAGTTSSDFLGTVNNQPLIFRTNAQDHGRITAAGAFQLYGATIPSTITELVQVEGGVKLTGGSNASNPGTIRYTPSPSAGVPGKFEGYVSNPLGPAVTTGWKQLDNVLAERKKQESPVAGVGCADPTNTALTAAAVTAPTRPWPTIGGSGPFGTLNGPNSPYYGYWEDSRRQYLIRATDLNAAGICSDPTNYIRAIAFNASGSGGGNDRLHFLRFSLKNTAMNTIAAFDNAMAGYTFAMPYPPDVAGPPIKYSSHAFGYNVQNGWNVHGYDQGGPPGFIWTGGNLLIDAAVDDQDWPQVREGDVQSYNTTYQSMISLYCDACGGSGQGTCFWLANNPPTNYNPPTTPTNGIPAGTGSTAGGWGWYGGWTLTAGLSTITCDGTFAYSGGGTPSTQNKLPRVAFLCRYIGGGAFYNVGSYMYAQDGVMIGDAAWAAAGSYPANNFRGPGTISAKRSVWSNTSLLSDYVFDLYYDGKSKPQDATGADQYVRTPLKELPNYVERERHLPTVDGRDDWNKAGGFSVDKLGNQLWVTVEDQALYIKELNERMDALQQFLVEKKLKELEGK